MPRRLGKLGLVGAVVALVLAACGGPNEGGGSSGGGAQGTGPITFVAGKDTSGKYPKVIEKWNAAHPNEKVSMIELPEAADAQRSGFVTNLQAKSDKYGVLLFYRKDILDKAGKKPPTTFDELKALCPLAKQNNIDCYAGQFFKYEGLTVNFAEAVQAAGGEIMTDNGTKVALGAPAVQGLSVLADGFKQGEIPKQAITYKEQESQRAFVSGKLMFLRNWPYVYALAAKDEPANKVRGKFG